MNITELVNMAKIKEMFINRGRKYAWDYGNDVGYQIGILISGDESDIMDMKEMAYKELTALAITEEERCRNEAGAEAELERIKQTEDFTPLEEVKTIEIKKTLPKLARDTPKIDTSIVHKISSKACNMCGGKISWDLRPGRPLPLHVNKEGKQIGTGDCPEFGG